MDFTCYCGFIFGLSGGWEALSMLSGYNLHVFNIVYYCTLLFHYCVILPYLVKRTRKILDGNTL